MIDAITISSSERPYPMIQAVAKRYEMPFGYATKS